MNSSEKTEHLQKQTTVLADTHVHIYPCFDAGRAINYAISNMSRIRRSLGHNNLEFDVKFVLFLTERSDCNFFHDIATSKVPLARNGWKIKLLEEGKSISLTKDDSALYLFPGAQIATLEHLEVLALGTTTKFKDGLSLLESIRAVIDDGSLPVLPWSPGKWTFQRGRKIYEAITTFSPERLLLADNALRPYGWREPSLISKAKNAGFRVLGGSDPLPVPGEEQRIGSYCVLLADISTWDETKPLTSVCQSLGKFVTVSAGRRLSFPVLVLKLIQNMWHKRGLSVF
jgi:hypothetical protein